VSRPGRNSRVGIKLTVALCVVAVIAAACSSDVAQDTAVADQAPASWVPLPEREGPRRATSDDVPHVQLDVDYAPAVDAELRRRVFLLPDVTNRVSARSTAGARGLWLPLETARQRRDVLGISREFAHIHPDGSLHVWLPIERASEVDRTKWGELHPWVGRDDFWGGVTMIYAPETMEEVDITVRLVVDAYNLITGANVDPAELV